MPKLTDYGALSHIFIDRLFDVARETNDPFVHVATRLIAEDPEHWDDHIIYLARIQAEARKELLNQVAKLVRRNADPPMVLMDKAAVDQLTTAPGSVVSVSPGGSLKFISADEWPATERALIEVSEVVYFRDFLRSAWKRLTARRAS